jgi:carotenoid cleavage dioxygenase-like enzyme
VTGSVPTERSGRYLRNGPNPLGLEDPGYRFWEGHWFLGPGMVHGVRLRDGKAEWYRNRWARSRQLAEALGEKWSAGPGARRHGLRRQHPHYRPRGALPSHGGGRPAALRAVR